MTFAFFVAEIMKFSKLLFFAACARADIDEEGLEESGITAQDVADVIIANDNIQQFIETNELTFNIVEGCDEVKLTVLRILINGNFKGFKKVVSVDKTTRFCINLTTISF